MGLDGLEKIQISEIRYPGSKTLFNDSNHLILDNNTVLKPKVLIFIDWFLPGFRAGGPIQSISNLVNHLGSELEISIVTSDRDLDEVNSYPDILLNKWISKENIRVLYLDSPHQNLTNYKRLLSEHQYDLVYFNSMFSVRFTLLPLWAVRNTKSKVILAPRGMLGEGALNIKKRKKHFFLSLLKLTGIAKKITWHATAETERSEIRKHFGDKIRVLVAPNLSASNQLTECLKLKDKNKLHLFFLSRIAKKKNLKIALDYLMKVDPKFNIDLTIIGPVDENDYWQECLKIIEKLPSHINVIYHGAIQNKELAGHLVEQHFMLLPTMHENFGHVIMESWQNGCPVIISDQTPWRNLQEKMIGWDIALDQPQQFIHAIETAAAMDQEDFTRMSKAATDYAQAFTSDPAVLEANRKLFEK